MISVPLLLSLIGLSASCGLAGDEVFSGPQTGEPLPSFVVRGVFDDDAGRDLDFVAEADGRPLVLIFVHDFNRQSVAFTRVLSQYAHSRTKDGLATGVVWLFDDASEGETRVRRARHAMAPGVPTGLSVDGIEGPGALGLNRNVMLTVLVAKDGAVTANHTFVQPGLQADLPAVLKSIVEVVGGDVPQLKDLEGMTGTMRPGGRAGNEALNLRPLLAPVIRRDATEKEVDEAAREVERAAESDSAVGAEVGRIARTIISAGKLANYGTARAQEYLTKWSDAYAEDEVSDPDSDSDPDSAKTDKTGDPASESREEAGSGAKEP